MEDQFAFGWFGVFVRLFDLEHSGSRAIHAANLHFGQVGIVHHANALLAGRKFGVTHVKLEWNLSFKVANDLRVCLGRVNRQGKNQGDE
jgi:hypothetical protein